MAKKRVRRNSNSTKSLLQILLQKLVDIRPMLPRWVICKCDSIGVLTVADLYRTTYLYASLPGIGSKFISVAQRLLADLDLPDRVGLEDPMKAVAWDARVQALREYNDMLPERLERHGAQMKEGFEASRSVLEELHELKVGKILSGFRRREKILKDALKDATRQDMAFTAPDVSPESAACWLTSHVAGRVSDGFEIKATLVMIARNGLPFSADMTLVLSSKSVALVLNEFSDRLETMVRTDGCFFLNKKGERTEVGEADVKVWFVSQEPGKLACLQGTISVDGMSDKDIKKLFIPTDLSDVSDDAFAHEHED